MNPSISEQANIQEYENFPLVWKPQESGDPFLFLVKMPAEMERLSQPDYDRLISLRLQWMIQTWMTTTGDSQPQTHQRLTQALRTLYLQEPPDLYEDFQMQELQPLWWWMQEWAETLLHRNETFKTKFQLSHPELSFPIALQPTNPQTQQQWLAEHNQITLADWLRELTSGME
jgi:hypothetical protein